MPAIPQALLAARAEHKSSFIPFCPALMLVKDQCVLLDGLEHHCKEQELTQGRNEEVMKSWAGL